MISDVARLMRTVFDRRVRRLGLTRAQWLVLTRLHRRPGASQSELADMMEVEKATAGRLIDRLEAKGWVERRAQAGDRRINRVYLTAEAERVHKRIWRIAEATVDDALADLSQRERAQLLKLLAASRCGCSTWPTTPPRSRSAAASATATRAAPRQRGRRQASGAPMKWSLRCFPRCCALTADRLAPQHAPAAAVASRRSSSWPP